MQIGFDNLNIATVWRGAGIPDMLPDGFEWWYKGHKFRHRPRGYTDGMSSPQFTHCIADANPRGWAFPGAVPHDGVYHNAIDIQRPDGTWEPFDMTKDEGDIMFKELLDVLAGPDEVKQKEAILFYEAVHLGGQSAFDEGRSKPPTV